MAYTAESVLGWTGTVFYSFKIFPCHSHTSMQLTFQKTIPLAKWGEGAFFPSTFAGDLYTLIQPYVCDVFYGPVCCLVQGCSYLLTGWKFPSDHLCCLDGLSLSVSFDPSTRACPSMDRVFQEECFLRSLSQQLILEEENILSEYLETHEVLS